MCQYDDIPLLLLNLPLYHVVIFEIYKHITSPSPPPWQTTYPCLPVYPCLLLLCMLCCFLFHGREKDTIKLLSKLQKSTRQMQAVCAHSKLVRDAQLALEVPGIKKVRECPLCHRIVSLSLTHIAPLSITLLPHLLPLLIPSHLVPSPYTLLTQALERLIFKMKMMVTKSSEAKQKAHKGGAGGGGDSDGQGHSSKIVWVGNLKIRRIDGGGKG